MSEPNKSIFTRVEDGKHVVSCLSIRAPHEMREWHEVEELPAEEEHEERERRKGVVQSSSSQRMLCYVLKERG